MKVGRFLMLKGVNKRIIEVLDTKSDVFEKAILFVNADKYNDGSNTLKQADEYLRKLGSETKVVPRSRRKRKAQIIKVFTFCIYLLIGAALTVFIQTLLKG